MCHKRTAAGSLINGTHTGARMRTDPSLPTICTSKLTRGHPPCQHFVITRPRQRSTTHTRRYADNHFCMHARAHSFRVTHPHSPRRCSALKVPAREQAPSRSISPTLAHPTALLVARVRASEHVHVCRPSRLRAHACLLLRPPSGSSTSTGTHPLPPWSKSTPWENEIAAGNERTMTTAPLPGLRSPTYVLGADVGRLRSTTMQTLVRVFPIAIFHGFRRTLYMQDNWSLYSILGNADCRRRKPVQKRTVCRMMIPSKKYPCTLCLHLYQNMKARNNES